MQSVISPWNLPKGPALGLQPFWWIPGQGVLRPYPSCRRFWDRKTLLESLRWDWRAGMCLLPLLTES